jgi:hypothetical protein
MDWVLVRDIGLWVLMLVCWVQLLWIRSLRKRVRELEWFRQYYWAQPYQNQGWQYWKW